MAFQQVLSKANNQQLDVPLQETREFSQTTTWRHPRVDCIKINFKISIIKQKCIGMILVARNHDMDVLMATTCTILTMFVPVVAEDLCFR